MVNVDKDATFTLKEIIYVAGVLLGGFILYLSNDAKQAQQIEFLERGRTDNRQTIEELRKEVQATRSDLAVLKERLAEHDQREKDELQHFTVPQGTRK